VTFHLNSEREVRETRIFPPETGHESIPLGGLERVHSSGKAKIARHLVGRDRESLNMGLLEIKSLSIFKYFNCDKKLYDFTSAEYTPASFTLVYPRFTLVQIGKAKRVSR
jgi:hypothetical protein